MRLWTLALVLTFFVGHVVAPSAYATDGYGSGSPNAGLIPDDGGHNYCWSTGFGGTDTAAAARRSYAAGAVADLGAETDMWNAGQQACGTSTDVYWATFSAALDGSYQCQVVVSAGRCDRSLVQINPGNMSPSDADWKQTTCHELGHSAGMGHMTTDCQGTSTSLQSYNSTHTGHVNDTF